MSKRIDHRNSVISESWVEMRLCRLSNRVEGRIERYLVNERERRASNGN
ncbi:hypothetical protein [Halosegnis longus]|nr:hypothetical protein [Salella cibi]